MDLMNLQLHDRVTCPFNPAHVMNYSKFHNHFVKCQKAHPNDRRKQCPYNASELIEPEEMDEHILNCAFIHQFQTNLSTNENSIFVDDSPYDIEFGESNTPIRKKNSRMDNALNDSDDEIDSVSVIAEAQRYNRVWEDNKKTLPNTTYNQPSVVKPLPKETKGFGRGAFIKKLMDMQVELSELPPKRSDDDIPFVTFVDNELERSGDSFSFLCLENVKGGNREEKTQTSRDMSSVSSSSSSSSRINFHERDKTKDYISLYGRGRGKLF